MATGQSTNRNPQAGQTWPSSTQTPNGQVASSVTPTGVIISPRGNEQINPSLFDFNTLPTPFIDFQNRFDEAQALAGQNRDVFFNEITSEESRNAALGLVNTDVTGIINAAGPLGNLNRAEGFRDTQENIRRAEAIDAFDFSRIPSFNDFNRREVSKANRFAQEEQDRAVDASGLDFRGRITGVLDRLDDRARGRLPGELDEKLTKDLLNRGADLVGGTGIGGLSGAGIRAGDRMTISERVNLALSADQQIPGTLSQAQSVLQAPIERAPTIVNQPTDVPLNISRVSERLPVTSSISAGQAQLDIGKTATDIGTISAETFLSGAISTDQFNETSAFERDKFVGLATQDQLTAGDRARQNLINADKADAIRAEQKAAAEEGLKIRQRSDTASGIGSVLAGIQAIGALGGLGAQQGTAASGTGAKGTATQGSKGTVSTGGQQENGIVSQVLTGAGNILGAVATGTGKLIDGVAGVADKVFGDGDGKLMVGSQQISGAEFNDFLKGVGEFVTTGKVTPSKSTAESKDASELPMEERLKQSPAEPTMEERLGESPLEPETRSFKNAKKSSETKADENKTFAAVKSFLEPVKDLATDRQLMSQTAQTMMAMQYLNDGEKFAAIGSLSANILEKNGVLTGEESRSVNGVTTALGTIANKNASDAQKASAISSALVEIADTEFTGSIDNPTSIGGRRVVEASSNADTGESSFVLDNGDIVNQSALVNSQNAKSAVQALSVLTSGADTSKKLTALAAVGVDRARAGELITQTQNGNMLAALSLVNTAQNWEQMNTIQKAVSTLQTGHIVLNATNQALGPTAAKTGTSAANSALRFTGSKVAEEGTKTAVTQAAAKEGTKQAVTKVGTQTVTKEGSKQAASQAGNTTLGQAATILGGAAILTGGVLGLKQAADVISASDDMSQSHSVKASAIGGAGAGAGIGAAVATGSAIAAGASAGATIGSTVPVVGTVIGAAVGAAIGIIAGSTGTGKDTGQLMRDSWRDSLEKAGLAEKIDGAHHVTLADGSKYNIGVDGSNKLQNVGTNLDGNSERYSFDIDWSNQAAVDNIPSAHLYALASGLNPTNSKDFDLFHRATAQSLNAATSNAITSEGVKENFKAMMKDTNPIDLAMRVETLRAQELITDEEGQVYLHHINQMYGSKLTQTDRPKLVQGLVERISAIPEKKRADSDKELLKALLNKEILKKNRRDMLARIKKDQSALESN